MSCSFFFIYIFIFEFKELYLSPSVPDISSWFSIFPSCFGFFFWFFPGRPCSRSIKHVKSPAATTTSRAACSSLGSVTIKAESPLTRPASTSGTPCRTCSPTERTHLCSSLTCRCPLSLHLGMSSHTWPVSFHVHCRPTERELTERQIKTSLREIMTQKDLENVTCKEVSLRFP